MASIDTTARSADELLADALARIKRLEQRRALAYTSDGRVRFPTGIDTEGEGDAGDPGSGGGTPDPVTGLTLTAGALFDEIYLDADWTLPDDLTAVVGIEIRLAKVIDPGGAGETIEVADVWRTGLVTSTRIRSLEPNTTYDVTVYTYSTTAVSTPATERATTGVDTDPPGIPTGLAVSAGLRTIVATWVEVADRDVVDGAGLYELELWDDTAGSPGTMLRRKRVGAELASFGDLDPETTYHVRVRAVDSSGNPGGWTGYVDATTVLAGTADIAAGSITADSAIIADAAIVSAKIADLAVTNAKIADLSATKITAGNISATVGITTGRISVGSGPGSTGVYLDSSGIRLYDGADLVAHLDANDGSALFRGTVDVQGSYGGVDVQSIITGGVHTFRSDGTVIGKINANNAGGGALILRHGDVPPNTITGPSAQIRLQDWNLQLSSGPNADSEETRISLTTSNTASQRQILYLADNHLMLGTLNLTGTAEIADGTALAHAVTRRQTHGGYRRWERTGTFFPTAGSSTTISLADVQTIGPDAPSGTSGAPATIQRDGIYTFYWALRWSVGAGSTLIRCWLNVNNTDGNRFAVAEARTGSSGDGSSILYLHGSATLWVGAGTDIRLRVFRSNTGANVDPGGQGLANGLVIARAIPTA